VLVGATLTGARAGPASHTWHNLTSCSASGLVHSWQRRLRTVRCCRQPSAAECAYGSLLLKLVVNFVVVIETYRKVLSLLSEGVRIRQIAVFWNGLGSVAAFRATTFAGAASEETPGSMGQEALLRWVTSASTSTGKIVPTHLSRTGWPQTRWGAVPQIPAMRFTVDRRLLW
jgi:hypothetical protein